LGEIGPLESLRWTYLMVPYLGGGGTAESYKGRLANQNTGRMRSSQFAP